MTTIHHTLGDNAARQLANATKTAPQLATITPRWLTHLLQWVPVEAGIYRVNQVKNPQDIKVTCTSKQFENQLPRTFVDYDEAPREYFLNAVSTVLDETYKVAITRFDERIRVGGMAELSGFNLALNPRRHDTLAMVVRDLFPQGGNLEQATFWAGLRPMTPDGTPLVGPSPIPGLWLNTGHGTLGWTMAAGSGQLLSDLISGNTPDISDEGLTLARYG